MTKSTETQTSNEDIGCDTTSERILELGTRLDRLFTILAKDLRPNANSALIFSEEHTSPQEFCQTLMEYAFSSVFFTGKQAETNPALLRAFSNNVQPYIDMILDMNEKYGKAASIQSCDQIALAQDLGTLGDHFLTKQVNFEQELGGINPAHEPLRPRA